MRKPEAAVYKVIDDIAKRLPAVMEPSKELHYVKGHELIAQGDTVLSNGEKVDASKTYQQWMPVMIAVNHKKRLISAYWEKGGEGIAEYIKHINEMIDNNKQETVITESSIETKIKSFICKLMIKIQSLLNLLKPVSLQARAK